MPESVYGIPSFDRQLAFSSKVSQHPYVWEHWRLAENTGTTFAGSIRGSVLTISGATYTLAQPGPCQGGNAIHFTSGTLTGPVIGGYSKITIMAYLKMTTTSGAKYSIYSDRTVGSGMSFHVGAGIVGGGAAYNLDMSADGSGLAQGMGSTGQALNDGLWYHVTGVFDGTSGTGASTSNYKPYVNGLYVKNPSADSYSTFTPPTNGSNTFKFANGTVGAFIGHLAELVIFKDYAMPANEVWEFAQAPRA